MHNTTTRVLIGSREALLSQELQRVQVEGHQILVVRLGDELLALDDTCTHQKASLADVGELDTETREIECCQHGARFALDDGSVRAFPATTPLHVYPLVIEGDRVFLELTE